MDIFSMVPSLLSGAALFLFSTQLGGDLSENGCGRQA